MASTIKVDNVQNQPGTNIINKCSVTTTVGAGAGETVNVCAATVNLGRSGGTVNLTCGATQSGFGRTGTVDWVTTPKVTGDSPVTAATGSGYFLNTTAGTITVNLPAGSAGSIVSLADYAATWQTYNVTVTPNGSEKIGGINASGTLSTEGQSVTFVYVDSTQGWVNTMDSTSNVRGTSFISATVSGACNTQVTCGDYKTGIFKGPGTFCVSAGSGTLAVVDYLVVAGGGAGGGISYGGGGGAGGFRLSNGYSIPAPTMSPLASGTSIPLGIGAVPVTVGAGGAAPSPTCSTKGFDSVFSTITSAGGGRGMRDTDSPPLSDASGGSGGGGDADGPLLNGSGDTPATPIAQGNDGGASQSGQSFGGGGGGAGAVGTDGTGGIGSYIGDGFVGPTSPSYGTPGPTGSARYFAGGGGGASNANTPYPGSPGAGQSGGGSGGVPGYPGQSGNVPGGQAGTAGTVNTGSGGGGAGYGPAPAHIQGAGGSGIVIIRYKFQ